mmetsp:Transcript_15663/g.23731  ORF Transcript_15663/g.23731 Transcript_15663/m.23731 type:complete len:246 (+) Transcript_15663:61-798(+)
MEAIALRTAIRGSRNILFGSTKLSSTFVKRNFFASSTDHTNLLANAKTHRVGRDDERRTYMLVPEDLDLKLALKVDKLQLARLFAEGNHIYGAKVVQRSLGSYAQVCKPLLQMALKDAANGEPVVALASLDGLTKWVVGGIEGKHDIETLQRLEDDNKKIYEACVAIATGIPRPGHSVVGQGTYRDGEIGWTQLAAEYVNRKDDGESLLYEESGGKLIGIDHLADTSREGLMEAGGSMARYKFQS